MQFERSDFSEVAQFTASVIESIYSRQNLKPEQNPGPDSALSLQALPPLGGGKKAFESSLAAYASASAGLAAPTMIGHMDTAPHPIAAFTDAVVSALNNNLLFRELSPAASDIEEHMVSEIGRIMGLSGDWHGSFVSGGSLANLTALFAACGGYAGVEYRADIRLFLARGAHQSIFKSAALLGIHADQIHILPGDEQGRLIADELEYELSTELASQGVANASSLRPVVISVAGSTVHGAVDSISAIADVCERFDAWLHVDAIYGAAAAFSKHHRGVLEGLNRANSVVAGPQKWMYVPRLSAMFWVRDEAVFNKALVLGNSYSAAPTAARDHRGRIGIQGSRRADAVTLWVLLNYLGTEALGQAIDSTMSLTQHFYDQLVQHPDLEPAHAPDLNVQCFRYRDSQLHRQRLDEGALHEQMGSNGVPWVSQSRWGEGDLLRAVILSTLTGDEQIQALLDLLRV